VTGPERHRDSIGGRLLVGLYPPSWRRRYRDELLALLADTGLSVRIAANLVRAAGYAWIRPPHTCHNETQRRRTSVVVSLWTWMLMAAALIVYGQLYEDQLGGSVTPGHPHTADLFRLCQVSAAASVAVLLLGNAPVYLQLVQTAARRGRRGDLVLLGLPLIAPAAFLVVLLVVSHSVQQSAGGVGSAWFLALCALGLAAGAAAVAGPAVVLDRSSIPAATLRRSVIVGAVSLAFLTVAAVAAGLDLLAIHRWGVGTSPVVTAPLALVVAYAAISVLILSIGGTSVVRGLRR
jgi:MFS family permease